MATSVAAGSITLTIEQLPNDSAPNQRAFTIRLANNSSKDITIRSFYERLSKNVQVEVLEDAHKPINVTDETLRSDISGFINRIIQSSILKSDLSKLDDGKLGMLFRPFKFTPLLKIASFLYRGASFEQIDFIKSAEQLEKGQIQHLAKISLRSNKEVQQAIQIWAPSLLQDDFKMGPDIGDPSNNVFASLRFKLEALGIFEGESPQPSSLEKAGQILSPGQELSKNVVLTFPTSKLTAKTYSIEYVAEYDDAPGDNSIKAKTLTASTTVTIGIGASTATTFAVLASLVSLLLVPARQKSLALFLDHLASRHHGQFSIDWLWISTPVLALFAVNLYDRTDLKSKFVEILNWKLATLIGLLCGVAGERIFSALQQLVK